MVNMVNMVNMDLRFLEYGAENGNFSNIDITDFIEDSEGKEVWMRYLMKQGYENIVIPRDEYNIYDMSAEKGGKTYIFELKKRPCKSTAFNDNIIELQKFHMLKSFSNTGYPTKIVNIFEDCIYINDLNTEHEFQDHFAQRTNNWNRDKIKKVLVSYKHENCIKINL